MYMYVHVAVSCYHCYTDKPILLAKPLCFMRHPHVTYLLCQVNFLMDNYTRPKLRFPDVVFTKTHGFSYTCLAEDRAEILNFCRNL
jgi:hypothetical protein